MNTAMGISEMVNVQYAGIAIRLMAFVFDFILIVAYTIYLFAVTMVIFLVLDLSIPENPIVGDIIAFFTLVLPVILYFTLSESSSYQATWGKRKVGLRVVDANGSRLTWWRAFVRSLVKLMPWQIAHTSIYQIRVLTPGQDPSPLNIAGFAFVYLLVGMYVLSALISKKHRAPYDWAASSYVIVQEG